ncbi:27286_t:CDS:2, partial [Racocetra persica]
SKIAEDGNWIIKNIKTLLKNFQKDLGLLLSADGHGNLAPYGQDLTKFENLDISVVGGNTNSTSNINLADEREDIFYNPLK